MFRSLRSFRVVGLRKSKDVPPPATVLPQAPADRESTVLVGFELRLVASARLSPPD